MATVIFVHGTGVREATYKESFQQIAQKLSAARFDITIIPCFWGEKHGAVLRKEGASIPEYADTRAPGQLDEEDYEIALWGLLYEDPLYELRILAQQAGPLGRFVPNRLTPYQLLDPVLATLTPSGGLEKQLRECRLENHWVEAQQRVRSSAEYRQALQNAPVASGHYRLAIARALVAQATWLSSGQHDGMVWMDGEARETLVALVTEALGGTDRGLGSWVRGHLANLALRYVTNRVRRRRGAVSDQASPLAGDILLYQARGNGIRGVIRDAIAAAPPPVVLLAHSLGGIACVDLLILEALPVELLITVGSQSPFFYEINALCSLPFGDPLPAHFPKSWVNIYDPHDFLSYVASGVFSGGVNIMDIRVDNRQPFPHSHCAYWSNQAVWDAIAQRIP